MVEIAENLRRALLAAQGNEITEYNIYKRLARAVDDAQNRRILRCIAADELRHYRFFRRYTGRDVAPRRFAAAVYYLFSRVFGLVFSIKLMEKGENRAYAEYNRIAAAIPEAAAVARDEEHHENQLINMLDEERLKYVGAVVRGLNDALVELTGALAGFTFALGDTRIIAMVGMITGIAASFSMAGSEYLARKSEEQELVPWKAAASTGVAYIMTVVVLILPYLIFSNVYICLALMITAGILIIAFFNFYIAVAQDLSFTRRFGEMAAISLGIAVISFGIGAAIRGVLGVDI